MIYRRLWFLDMTDRRLWFFNITYRRLWFLDMICRRILTMNSTTEDNNGAKILHPPGKPEFIPVISYFMFLNLWFSMARFMDHCLSFYRFSLGNCFVSPLTYRL